MKLWDWFLPHKDTHKKAHLISWEGLVIYILIFMFLQVSFSLVNFSNKGVLGISSNVDAKRLIELTNGERQKKGLNSLIENEALSKAAHLKAQNMFTEGYWAHFAPSGKSPWDFILGSGYRFTYAGENLAKNFYESNDVVVAWMDSPTHRDNLLSPKYHDIGIAVVEGVLNGQQTTLVVQEFGSTQTFSSSPIVSVGNQTLTIPKEEYEKKPELLAAITAQSVNQNYTLDPFLISKTASLSIISLMAILLICDFVILKRRGVFRLGSHHIAHMSLLTAAAAGILSLSPGSIL